MSFFLALFPLVFSDESPYVLEHGSGVFTMTFWSTEVVYLNLCYVQWPSFPRSFSKPSCVFHPHPYNFTIHPEYATKIGRPLRNIQSDYITVSINVTDQRGGYHGHILETIMVDGSTPSRTVSTYTDVLSVDFEVRCNENFFGPRCGRFCKPSSAENFRYGCTHTGKKVCVSGWTGTNCSVSDENRIISRFGRSNGSADLSKLQEPNSKECLPLFTAAAFITMFISCALYLISSQRRLNVYFANVVTY